MENKEEILIRNLKNKLLNHKLTLEEMDNIVQDITKCSSSIFDSLSECIEDGFCVYEIHIRI